jgi:hypothetical protein
MKIFLSFFVILVFGSTFAFTQTREDTRIFIPPVRAHDPFHALFFHEAFSMELAGAGYTQTGSAQDSDYTLNLEVRPNMILFDDGTEEQAPPGEQQFIIVLHLVRNEDNIEIVTLSFPFDDTDEMYEFNLPLLYQAMANVPLTRLGDIIIDVVEEDDRWRNKWLYVRASFDYPIKFYQRKSPQFIYSEDRVWPQRVHHEISPFPAVTIGVEFQYLHWMSTELDFNLSFRDPMSNAFIPSIQIEQKFPIKPAEHFKISPYVAIAFPLNTSSAARRFPRVGLGGGAQLGVRGGNMGAFFVDINYIHFLGTVVMRNDDPDFPVPDRITYNRFVVGLGIGYKIGFLDRPGR